MIQEGWWNGHHWCTPWSGTVRLCGLTCEKTQRIVDNGHYRPQFRGSTCNSAWLQSFHHSVREIFSQTSSYSTEERWCCILQGCRSVFAWISQCTQCHNTANPSQVPRWHHNPPLLPCLVGVFSMSEIHRNSIWVDQINEDIRFQETCHSLTPTRTLCVHDTVWSSSDKKLRIWRQQLPTHRAASRSAVRRYSHASQFHAHPHSPPQSERNRV